MTAILADTHALLWYLQAPSLLSFAADHALTEADESGAGIGFSAISLIEACYLAEKNRIASAAWHELLALLADRTMPLAVIPVDESVARSIGHVPRNHIPDMPDRIIAATALAHGLPLVTRDQRLREARVVRTIW